MIYALADATNLKVWALVILGCLGIVTLITTCLITVNAIKKESTHAGKILSEALTDGIVVRMATIFGIVMTAGILALADTLNDGAIAILSGIAGYVLGGIGRAKRPRESRPDQ